MRLHDLLDRVASADQPVSRLDAVHLYAGGQRRRRRVRLARGAGAFGATALAVVVVLVISTITGGTRKESEPPAQKDVENTFSVHRVGGYDRDHLWVYGEAAPGAGHHVASTDNGGRTWTSHKPLDPEDGIRGNEDIGLLGAVDGRPGVSAFHPMGLDPPTVFYTKDGWGTRVGTTLSNETVAAASTEALVFCGRNGYGPEVACPVAVFEPATNGYSTLAKQPILDTDGVARAPDGTIWAHGLDAASKRPAVASTADGGRTWSTHVFTDLPALTFDYPKTFGNFHFARNGTVLLTLLSAGADARHIFRFHGPDWQRLPDVGRDYNVATWLTDDGSHVQLDIEPPPTAEASQPATERSVPASPSPFISPGPPTNKVLGVRICPLGSDQYRRVSLEGLPTDQALVMVIALPGGGRVGWNWGGIWYSPDGTTWKEIPRPTR